MGPLRWAVDTEGGSKDEAGGVPSRWLTPTHSRLPAIESPRRVWFANEAVCRTLNDYTHSAPESGRATTLKVLYHLALGTRPKPHRSICATVILVGESMESDSWFLEYHHSVTHEHSCTKKGREPQESCCTK